MDKKLSKPIEEKQAAALNGFAMLIFLIMFEIAMIFIFILGISFVNVAVILISSILTFIVNPIMFAGFRILKPNEALVLTLFGKYKGTLKKDGFFWINPFCIAINPTPVIHNGMIDKKISLKAMTLDNQKQKVNDETGNPIEIGIIVIWKIVNTAEAVFNVENYKEYISIQADSALRDVARLYPYDISAEGDEKSLRGSSQEISKKLRNEIQSRVNIAGVEIMEARITHLAYSPEIAAAMLQRQQAAAIIEARQKIVEGAVGMVDMALKKLNEDGICDLDEERKAAMVSNLLVVLCGNKDAQPIVNSGSIY